MKYIVRQIFETLGDTSELVFHDQIEAETYAAELREDICKLILEAFEVERPYPRLQMLSEDERRAWDVAQSMSEGRIWFTREAAAHVADQAVVVEIDED